VHRFTFPIQTRKNGQSLNFTNIQNSRNIASSKLSLHRNKPARHSQPKIVPKSKLSIMSLSYQQSQDNNLDKTSSTGNDQVTGLTNPTQDSQDKQELNIVGRANQYCLHLTPAIMSV
jgi:hypothetical protein